MIKVLALFWFISTAVVLLFSFYVTRGLSSVCQLQLFNFKTWVTTGLFSVFRGTNETLIMVDSSSRGNLFEVPIGSKLGNSRDVL